MSEGRLKLATILLSVVLAQNAPLKALVGGTLIDGHGDPELTGVSAESDAADLAIEDALHAGGGDALLDGDHTRVGKWSQRRARARLLRTGLQREKERDDHV